MDPCRPLPASFGAEPAGRKAVAVHFAAELKARAEAGLRVAFLTLRGEAGAGANAELTYYFLNRADRRWGTAVVNNVTRLGTSPFDLKGLEAQFRRGELMGLLVRARGNLDYAGRVGVATPLGVLQRGNIKLEAGLAFAARRAGEFRFEVRPDPDREQSVLVAINRESSLERQSSASLAVSVDLSELYATVKPELVEHLGDAGELLEDIEAWLMPSEQWRKNAAELLKTTISNDGLRELAAATLGVDAAKKPEEVLQRLAGERIMAVAGDWEEATPQVARRLADHVAGELETWVKGILTDWRKGAEKAMKDFVKEDARFRKVADALMEIDESVEGALGDLDQRLAAARLLVKRTAEMLEKLRKAAQDATEIKLAARLGWERRQASGEGLEALLRFKLQGRDAPKALRQVLLGQIAPVFDDLARGRLSKSVELLEGQFSGFLSSVQTTSAEVVLLDFAVGGRSVLSANTRFQADASGNVTVTSQASLSQGITLPWERRTFSLTESLHLAAAARLGTFDLRATVSKREAEWDEDDIRGFLAGLPAAGLVGAETVREVTRYVGQHHDQLRGAELSLDLRLDDAGVRALMSTGLSEAQARERARRAAAEELAPALVKVPR
jgi:hypothetical protein